MAPAPPADAPLPLPLSTQQSGVPFLPQLPTLSPVYTYVRICWATSCLPKPYTPTSATGTAAPHALRLFNSIERAGADRNLNWFW
jgi:hypothetical protein